MSTEADLLAAIYAHPGDDELRRVYADLLGERGDPRGELIVLQLRRAAGVANERELEQERALLRRHVATWLGPIARVVELGGGLSAAWARGRTRFERGFLATAFLKSQLEPSAVDDPGWATCEELRGYYAHHLDLLVRTPFRALRRLRGAGTFGDVELAALATRRSRLAVDRVPILLGGKPLPPLAHVFPDAEAHFTITNNWSGDVDALAACGIPRARLFTYARNLADFAAAFQARPAGFERVVIEGFRRRSQPLAEVELVRGPDGRYG